METDNPDESQEKDKAQAKDDLGIPSEFMDALPIEERGRVSKVLSMMMMGVSRPTNPITKNITPDVIRDVIESGNKRDERDREDKQRDRYFNAFVLVFSVLAGFGLIYFLKDDKDLLEKLFTALLAFGSGFGVGKITNKPKSD